MHTSGFDGQRHVTCYGCHHKKIAFLPMMRFRLRTLLILLAIGPPLIALAWWYGKLAIGLLVFALIVCPQLVFELAMLLLVVGTPRNDHKDSP
jgi:hypothetical protein